MNPLRAIADRLGKLTDLHPTALRELASKIAPARYEATDDATARALVAELLEACAELHELVCGCTRPPN